MKSYVLRRLWQAVLVLFGVSVVVFAILHLTGDPAALLLPPDATAEDIARFRHAMELVLERLPATFQLAGAGLLLALCLAVPAGIVSAVKRNTVIDYFSTVV